MFARARAPAILGALVLMALASCTAGPDSAREHRPRAPVPSTSPERSVDYVWPTNPARARYVDGFAGFAFTPPSGWIEPESFHAYMVSPNEQSLVAPPPAGRYEATSFGVQMLASRTMTRARLRRDIHQRWNACGGCRRAQSSERIAGRAAARYALEVPLERRSGGGCGGCRFEWYVIPWDFETVLWFQILAGSPDLMTRHGDDARAMIRSLRPAEIDPDADAVRAFLSARAAGRGAERWLTEASARAYAMHGLYAIGEPGETNHSPVTDFEARGDEIRGSFTVTVQAKRGRQTERVVVGAGKDVTGRRRSSVVLAMVLIQKAGTS